MGFKGLNLIEERSKDVLSQKSRTLKSFPPYVIGLRSFLNTFQHHNIHAIK